MGRKPEESSQEPRPLRVLFVEDNPSDSELCVRELERQGFRVHYCSSQTADEFTRLLADHPFDIVLADYGLPLWNGLEALRLLKQKKPDTPFILVTGSLGDEAAVECIKLGAADYVLKDRLSRLPAAVRQALKEKRLRDERADLQQRMHRLERFEAIGQLAGGVAHDFNNLICAIRGWAEMGLRETPAASQLHKHFQMIEEQADRAATLTRQLLAFARRQLLEPREIHLNQILTDISAFVGKVFVERIHVEARLGASPDIVRADPTQVEQVIMNLCLNARDAMPHGGELILETRNAQLDAVAARSFGVRPGPYVLLVVRDTGEGMDPQIQARIFEPFFTTKGLERGTGLGLATVQGIVSQHGGHIQVRSQRGAGSTFEIHWPAGTGQPAVAPRAEVQPPRGGHEVILVAEDHEGLRWLVAQTLHLLGYKTLVATNGQEALELFEANCQRVGLPSSTLSCLS